ncbi:MAG: hypothetical protein AAFN92_07910 [Bacteroidota bacterium]
MYNLTQKNDRRRRRKARLLTAFITLVLLAAASYFSGALDHFFEPVEEIVVASV